MEELFDPTIITLFNPSKQDFEIVYNNKIFRTIPPQKAMRLPKKPFGVLAEKHLIDRMCNEENRPTNDPITRDKWRKVVVMDEDQDLSAQPLTKEEILERQIDKLNHTNESQTIATCDTCGTKTFNLLEHKMLNHTTQENTPSPTVTPVIAQDSVVASPVIPKNVEVLGGESLMPLSTEKPAPTTDAQVATANILQGVTGRVATEEGATTLKEVAEDPPQATPAQLTPAAPPTREQLISYARDTLLMKVDDPKTKELLDTAPIETLVKELSYGI